MAEGQDSSEWPPVVGSAPLVTEDGRAERRLKGVLQMVRVTMSLAALMLVLGLSGPAAARKAPKNPQCPACKMTLSARKSAVTPTPVKIGKKTYYCCDKCAMPKAGVAKAKGKKPSGSAS